MLGIKASPFAAAAPERSYWVFASVAVNLLLVGLILAWTLAQPARRQPLVTWQRELAPSLNPSDAAIVAGAADRIAAAQTEADKSVHVEYAHLRALLAAEPVDPAALNQSLHQIESIRNDEQSAMHTMFLNELTAISPEGRAKMLGAMERESQHWRPPHQP